MTGPRLKVAQRVAKAQSDWAKAQCGWDEAQCGWAKSV